jgi:predicted DCC family thiol-disulfide oxidoreductase YuxK
MSGQMQSSWRPRDIDGVPDGLVLFDGVCILCSGWVRFLLARDHDGDFRFTPIQSPYGRQLAERLGIDPETPETNALIAGGRAYFKLDSMIEALQRFPRWRWVRVLAILPRPVRDWCYDRIARNRYRLFGRTERCMVPTPEVSRRFLVDPPGATPARAEQR